MYFILYAVVSIFVFRRLKAWRHFQSSTMPGQRLLSIPMRRSEGWKEKPHLPALAAILVDPLVPHRRVVVVHLFLFLPTAQEEENVGRRHSETDVSVCELQQVNVEGQRAVFEGLVRNKLTIRLRTMPRQSRHGVTCCRGINLYWSMRATSLEPTGTSNMHEKAPLTPTQRIQQTSHRAP